MVFSPKTRATKGTKDDSTPTTEPSPSQAQPPSTATQATPPPQTATPPPAPRPTLTISIPTSTNRQVDDSPLSPAPNGSMGKKARRRQEKLDKAAIAAGSRREVSIKVLKGIGPTEVVDENRHESSRNSSKTPPPETDRQSSSSPTKPGPTERRSPVKKSKRRYEPLDLNDEPTAAAERENFLKRINQNGEPSRTVDDTGESAVDSPKSPAHAADQQCGSQTTSHRAGNQMSKKSKLH